MKICNKNIGENNPCFIIAEAGINHQGDINLAKKLVDVAVDAGVDAVKFQMRNLNNLFREQILESSFEEDLQFQYNLDIIRESQLSFEEFSELVRHCKEKNIIFMCTPWDMRSVDDLEKLDVPAYKVASADMKNLELLEYLISKNKPLIISTGMSTTKEIEKVVKFLKERNAMFILLHCNSTYPAPYKDINLVFMHRLMDYGVIAGYSGHERGLAVVSAAVALGAKVIEKHFTLDKNMRGPDHKISLDASELKQLVENVRAVEQSLGERHRYLSQGEMINREVLGKSLVAAVNIPRDTKITKEMITARGPGKGLSPLKINELLGKISNRDIVKHDYFINEDIERKVIEGRGVSFNRKWGIIVRYHDIDKMLQYCCPDFLELHLSYRDLDYDYSKKLKKYDQELIVHAPELFEDDNLLDLCTEDEEKREISIKNLQRIIDISRDLRKNHFSKSADKIKIVIHVGGFSMDSPINKKGKVEIMYKNLIDSLGRLDASGIELLPETMPPFPWIFGGQCYHNIFVDENEIIDFCKKTGLKICLDLSHSALYCNKENKDFSSFVRKMAPYTAHLHISDAKGVDGEGLQIDEGCIDFEKVFAELKECDAGFVTEIWQGHKFGGKDLFESMKRLKSYVN